MEKLNEGSRLTNYLPNNPVEIGNLKLGFSYKRDDLNILNLSDVSRFFSGIQQQKITHTYLTNSGQISSTLIINYLKTQKNIKSLTSFSTVYAGTQQSLEHFGISVSTNDSSLLWICSSTFSKDDFAKINSKKWNCIIIDTTCWSLDEENYLNLIQNLKHECLIEVRSKSKLDMMGVEYGSLGSIVISDSNQFIDTAILRMMYCIFSAAPSLCDIPASLFSDDHHQQNLERCSQIMKNTAFLQSYLKNNQDISFYFPEHSKYFFLIFNPLRFKEIKHVRIHLFLALLSESKLSFKCIKSFGFNFWNFDLYKNNHLNQIILRTSVANTQSRSELNKIIYSFKSYIKILSHENQS